MRELQEGQAPLLEQAAEPAEANRMYERFVKEIESRE